MVAGGGCACLATQSGWLLGCWPGCWVGVLLGALVKVLFGVFLAVLVCQCSQGAALEFAGGGCWSWCGCGLVAQGEVPVSVGACCLAVQSGCCWPMVHFVPQVQIFRDASPEVVRYRLGIWEGPMVDEAGFGLRHPLGPVKETHKECNTSVKLQRV